MIAHRRDIKLVALASDGIVELAALLLQTRLRQALDPFRAAPLGRPAKIVAVVECQCEEEIGDCGAARRSPIERHEMTFVFRQSRKRLLVGVLVPEKAKL